jgi:hypothetical protein
MAPALILIRQNTNHTRQIVALLTPLIKSFDVSQNTLQFSCMDEFKNIHPALFVYIHGIHIGPFTRYD